MGHTPMSARQQFLNEIAYFLRNDGVRLFVTLNGAVFPDLPETLAKADIAHRPLYKGNDLSVLMGGPWIVSPYMPLTPPRDPLEVIAPRITGAKDQDISALIATHMNEAISKGDPTGDGLLAVEDFTDKNAAFQRLAILVEKIPELSGLIVWIGDSTATWNSFYEHLRRLNRIWMPRRYIHPSGRSEIIKAASSPYADFEYPTHDFVVFRHADANVLRQILPVLNQRNQIRFMGPFHSVVFYPDYPWDIELRYFDRPEGDGGLQKAPLVMDITEMAALENERLVGYDRQFATDLVEEYPKFKTIDKEEFLASVTRYRKQAIEHYHISQMPHVLQYIAMCLLYEKQVQADQDFHGLFASHDLATYRKLQYARNKYPLGAWDI